MAFEQIVCTVGVVEVTYDDVKDAENVIRHGISLTRAKDFDFNTAMVERDVSQDNVEIRYKAIGWLDALLYSLTFTDTKKGIRAISLRKAERQERNDYAEEY